MGAGETTRCKSGSFAQGAQDDKNERPREAFRGPSRRALRTTAKLRPGVALAVDFAQSPQVDVGVFLSRGQALVAEELLAYRLATFHNLHFYMTLMARIREAIREVHYGEFRKEFIDRYGSLEEPALSTQEESS